MIENAIGMLSLPLGIATNFIINGKKYMIPMAIEEPSVIAAASNAAKIASANGGFVTSSVDDALMIGQVQLVSISEESGSSFVEKLLHHKEEIIQCANSVSASVVARDLQTRVIQDESQNHMGKMLIVEILVDTKDSMGANTINKMCERIAPRLESLSGGKANLRILSNYSTKRIVRSRALFGKDGLGGESIVDRILYAYAFAHSDPYRAVTHNKGIMNGIDAVAIATGQDFRAIEAAAHAYASRDGQYRSLTKWFKTETNDLLGELELPLAVGTVGGIISVHPTTKLGIKLLGVKNARELASVIASVGLAQNLAAMRALVTQGIQAGHMRLHARNIAVMAGAKGELVKAVATRIANENNVNLLRAKEIVAMMSKGSNNNTHNNK
jgi:hydroxymethylglutaryl-CoA reductase